MNTISIDKYCEQTHYDVIDNPMDAVVDHIDWRDRRYHLRDPLRLSIRPDHKPTELHQSVFVVMDLESGLYGVSGTVGKAFDRLCSDFDKAYRLEAVFPGHAEQRFTDEWGNVTTIRPTETAAGRFVRESVEWVEERPYATLLDSVVEWARQNDMADSEVVMAIVDAIESAPGNGRAVKYPTSLCYRRANDRAKSLSEAERFDESFVSGSINAKGER
jgi:hypothetical protein